MVISTRKETAGSIMKNPPRERRWLSSSSSSSLSRNTIPSGLFICIILSWISTEARGLIPQSSVAARRTSSISEDHPSQSLLQSSPSSSSKTTRLRLVETTTTEFVPTISIDKEHDEDLEDYSRSRLQGEGDQLSLSGSVTILPKPLLESDTSTGPGITAQAVNSDDMSGDKNINMKDEDKDTSSTAESSTTDSTVEDDETSERIARTAKAAALLARKGRPTAGSRSVSTRKANKSTTSVGARRIGSASKARTAGRSATTRLADAIKTGNSVGRPKSVDERDDRDGSSAAMKCSSSTPSRAMIEATIDSMMTIPQSRVIAPRSNQPHRTKNAQKTMGLFGEAVYSSPTTTAGSNSNSRGSAYTSQLPSSTKAVITKPRPGSFLIKSKMQLRPQNVGNSNHLSRPMIDRMVNEENVVVRVAKTTDDVQIANLRLSVFSNFTAETRRAFCDRSCQLLATRRHRGATCVVATIPANSPAATDVISSLDDNGDRTTTRTQNSFFPPTLLSNMWSQHTNSGDVVIGTAEISFHEFEGTKLGKARSPDSILYVTEVAVNRHFRRQGIAKLLMQSVDKIATLRKVETVYLHVDTENARAIKLYKDAGYNVLPKDRRIFSEFTRKLNLHDGFTKGRNHYLLSKNLKQATWHPYNDGDDDILFESSPLHVPSTRPSTKIGFDIHDESLHRVT